MSIIDHTYFIRSIELPTESVAQRNKLQLYIDEAQRVYLEKCLGYELYALFIAELPTPTSQRFTDLLNGKVYTGINGKAQKWIGLANSEKESLLAYFAYYLYSKANQQKETGTGSTSQSFENSNLISPGQLQSDAYNRGVKLYNEMYLFMYYSGNYPELDFSEIKQINWAGI